MGKIISVFAALLCLVSAQTNWGLVGFENENVKCIAQHPQDTSIMLISIADSIYRSSDGGYSWSFVVDFWSLSVNCLTFDPLQSDTVFALVGDGTESDAIYRSTDAGSRLVDICELYSDESDVVLLSRGYMQRICWRFWTGYKAFNRLWGDLE
ncbi:hypothetical protein KAX97_08590 [candidate division WOR-3 bacterium]|nr:hypothetical protein [candidate division WOR-3 bacterium]